MKHCPVCGGKGHPAFRLCRACWFRLPALARGRIYADRGKVDQRHGQLLAQIEAGADLESVVID